MEGRIRSARPRPGRREFRPHLGGHHPGACSSCSPPTIARSVLRFRPGKAQPPRPRTILPLGFLKRYRVVETAAADPVSIEGVEQRGGHAAGSSSTCSADEPRQRCTPSTPQRRSFDRRSGFRPDIRPLCGIPRIPAPDPTTSARDISLQHVPPNDLLSSLLYIRPREGSVSPSPAWPVMDDSCAAAFVFDARTQAIVGEKGFGRIVKRDHRPSPPAAGRPQRDRIQM